MKIKSSILLLCSFLTIWTGKSSLAADLQGKFALSAKGGMCHSMGNSFSSGANVDGNYGLGVSAEYFFLEALSGGIALTHNSFEGEWRRSGYYSSRSEYYYSDWNWTDVSIFGKFVLGPDKEVSPYLTAGMGLYFPRVQDKWYFHRDTIFTHTSYGKGQLGYHFGFGIHCLLTREVLIYLEVPFNVIHTEDLVIHWIDIPNRMDKCHNIYNRSQYFNIFAGISFLLGPMKLEEKTRLTP